MKIYLARPISGESYDDVATYYQNTAEYLYKLGFEVLHPMVGKGYLRTETKLRAGGYNQPISTNHAIAERDKWMVTQADIVLVNLLGATERVSIGCMMELAWASLLGKHTVVVMEEENIHRHAFVLEAADIVFTLEPAAISYLGKLITGSLAG